MRFFLLGFVIWCGVGGYCVSFGVLLDGGLGLLICLGLITLLCVGLIDCDYSVCLMFLVGTYCWLSGWLC